MRINKIKKIRAAGLPSLRLLMHSLKVKKENAVNCAIFLTLTRIPGPPLIAVCPFIIRTDLQKLFYCFGEFGNRSNDLELTANSVA